MDALWWCGAIGVVFAGWACSSYASNFSYRLPRGEDLFARKPYCGECNSALAPKDLFPILSFYQTDGRCRYCRAPIPPSYFVMELLFPLLFLAAYARFGVGETFLLAVLAGSALIVFGMMAVEDGFFSAKTLLFIAVCGLLMRGAVLDGLLGGFLGLMAAEGFHRLHRNEISQEFSLNALPYYVWLTATLGVAFAFAQTLLALALWWVFGFLFRRFPAVFVKPDSASLAAFAVAMSVVLLWG